MHATATAIPADTFNAALVPIIDAIFALEFAATGRDDAREAAWSALESLRKGFPALAAYIMAPDPISVHMDCSYRLGNERGRSMAANLVRSIAGIVERAADRVAQKEA
jgi:hypothetical protein